MMVCRQMVFQGGWLEFLLVIGGGGWFLWWLLEIEIYTICTPFMTCFTLHMKNIICKLYSNIIMD